MEVEPVRVEGHVLREARKGQALDLYVDICRWCGTIGTVEWRVNAWHRLDPTIQCVVGVGGLGRLNDGSWVVHGAFTCGRVRMNDWSMGHAPL